MDRIKNPFSPGAGSPPPELVGRDGILDDARVLLGRVKQGRPEKSLLLTGLRGVGKTVLLNEMEALAQGEGYETLAIEAHEGKSLGLLLVPHLRTLLLKIDRGAKTKEKVKRALGVLGSFISAIKVEANGFTFGFDIEPEVGAADSGDLEIDLPNLLVAVAEVAKDQNHAVALFIDEIQYFTSKELGALIMAMHKIQQRGLPLVLLGAGLPILPGLAGESKSYAERLFNFPLIGALSRDDAHKALWDPVQAMSVDFEEQALDEVFRLTQGYPYFLQEWGYQSWNLASPPRITLAVVVEASNIVSSRLDQNFFRVRYDRLTSSEKNFLRAMAGLGPHPQRTSDIANALGVKLASIGPVRANLIHKGMIYSPAHGEMAFTVPLFDEFMRRAIP